MFRFSLRAPNDVEPWGKPGQQTLHWFGFSDGSYFIDLGQHRLLEYCVDTHHSRYVEYQIARMHSDLLDMLPEVLSPVPVELLASLANDSILETSEALAARAGDLDDPIWDALEGFRLRRLDTLYLSPPAHISFWTHDQNTYVEWNNHGCLFEGSPAWTACKGRFVLPTRDFVSAVHRFHDEFMSQMRERVELARLGWPRSDVSIDVEALSWNNPAASGCST